MGRWAAAVAVVALATLAGCRADGAGARAAPDPAVQRWAVEVLGLDAPRARCTAHRVAAAGVSASDRRALVRSGLADLGPTPRQEVADAVTVCSFATAAEVRAEVGQ